MSGTTVRVVVADERPLSLEALSAALETHGLDVVARAQDADHLAEVVRDHEMSIVVVDERLPPAGGLAACRTLKDETSTIRVVLLGDEPDAAVLTAAVEVGIDGYVTRTESLVDLVQAIRGVDHGEARIPSGLLAPLLRHLIVRNRANAGAVDVIRGLTRREREVLRFLALGHDAGKIASVMVVSRHTVRTHVQNVLSKLDVHSQLEAAAFVHDHDLLSELEKKDRDE